MKIVGTKEEIESFKKKLMYETDAPDSDDITRSVFLKVDRHLGEEFSIEFMRSTVRLEFEVDMSDDICAEDLPCYFTDGTDVCEYHKTKTAMSM